MARIFQDGFEMGVPAQQGSTVFGVFRDSLWQHNQTHATSANIAGVSSGVKNAGEYSLMIYETGTGSRRVQVFRNLGQNLTEHYDRIELRVDNVQATECIYHYRDDNFDVVASIRIDDAYTLRFYVGGTEIGTIAGAIIAETFGRIESHYVVDDTNGIFEVKVNGNSLFSWEGNTDPLATGNIRYLCLGKISTNTRDITFFYDDIAINDTTGTVNNSWVGKGSILLLKPKGAGHYSQFTPNEAGNNWEKVNEVPNDGDTTYVESENAEEIDTYEMEELIADHAIDPDSIVKAVQVCFTGRYEGADAHLAPMLRSGVTDEEGDKKTLASSYHRLFQQIYSVNPFTTEQWTHEEVDALEAGVKHKEHTYG